MNSLTNRVIELNYDFIAYQSFNSLHYIRNYTLNQIISSNLIRSTTFNHHLTIIQISQMNYEITQYN